MTWLLWLGALSAPVLLGVAIIGVVVVDRLLRCLRYAMDEIESQRNAVAALEEQRQRDEHHQALDAQAWRWEPEEEETE